MSKKLDKIREYYCEWLLYKNAGKWGQDQLTEMGYTKYTKEEFCEINKIGKNTPLLWEKAENREFWDSYYAKMGRMRIDLPAIIKIMGKKDPSQWLRVMYPKQAKEAFSQKVEHSGDITIKDTKKALGESFVVIDDNEPQEVENG